MSSHDTAEQAAQWYWEGRQAYLHGQPCTPPPADINGVWRAGYAVAQQADLRRTMIDVVTPPPPGLFD